MRLGVHFEGGELALRRWRAILARRRLPVHHDSHTGGICRHLGLALGVCGRRGGLARRPCPRGRPWGCALLGGRRGSALDCAPVPAADYLSKAVGTGRACGSCGLLLGACGRAGPLPALGASKPRISCSCAWKNSWNCWSCFC